MSSVCWPRPYQPTLRLISRARHKQNGDFSLRPSAGTSKNVDTTFKHWDWNIKWAPAWWGHHLSGVKTFVKSRRKKENHFLHSLPFIVKIINNWYVCNLYLHSIILCQVGWDIPSLLQMSISRDTRHGHAEEQDEGLPPLTDTRIGLLFINQKLYYFLYYSHGSMRQEWQTCVTLYTPSPLVYNLFAFLLCQVFLILILGSIR